MGCFLVSAAAAIGVGVAKHIVKKYENDQMGVQETKVNHTKWSKKLSYLELTLWGGSFLLAGEHVLHGEITPYAPFLTAASNKEDTITMFKEMGTVGVSMLLLLVAAWGAGVAIHDVLVSRKNKKTALGENK